MKKGHRISWSWQTKCWTLALALLGAAATGCGTDPEDLSGTWTGSVTDDGVQWAFTLELQETNGVISGTFKIVASSGSATTTITGSVSGAYQYPGVNMGLTASIDGEDYVMSFLGTMTADGVLTGTATDTGGTVELTLRRE